VSHRSSTVASICALAALPGSWVLGGYEAGQAWLISPPVIATLSTRRREGADPSARVDVAVGDPPLTLLAAEDVGDAQGVGLDGDTLDRVGNVFKADQVLGGSALVRSPHPVRGPLPHHHLIRETLLIVEHRFSMAASLH
jgi:hypothetical protein